MTEGRLNITVLTAEDSLKVFRMTQERIDAALERFPEFKDKVNISITRTSTSFENDPSWNAEDYVKFRKGVADADIMIGYMFPLEEVKAAAPRLKWIHIIGAGVEHLGEGVGDARVHGLAAGHLGRLDGEVFRQGMRAVDKDEVPGLLACSCLRSDGACGRAGERADAARRQRNGPDEERWGEKGRKTPAWHACHGQILSGPRSIPVILGRV